MVDESTDPTADSLVELALTEIKKSKIITVSAKIAQAEFLALERLSEECRASKSAILREALRSYILMVAAESPRLAEALGESLIREVRGEDGSPSALRRCLEATEAKMGTRPPEG